MADVDSNLKDWSTTEASNKPSGATTIGTGLDDNIRRVQATVRQDLAHKGADIASVAGTTDIGAVAGLMHDITGTEAITGLGTVSAGIWKILKFEGAATLTHNATSLILPGAANITTANGDVGFFMSEGSGNWRCHSYQRAVGNTLDSGWKLLGTGTASNSASLSFTSLTGYAAYAFVFSNLIPGTDNVALYFRVSVDNGSNYKSGASDYSWTQSRETTGGHGSAADDADTQGQIANDGIDSGSTNDGVTGMLISGDLSVSKNHHFSFIASYKNNGGNFMGVRGMSAYIGTQEAVNAIQFLMSSGNIASGTIKCYGIRGS